MRSVRQSFASSTADRSMLPRYCSSFASNRANSANESAADPGEPGEDPVVVEAPDLPGPLLDDGVAQRHLAVAGEDGVILVTDRENRGAVEHGRQVRNRGGRDVVSLRSLSVPEKGVKEPAGCADRGTALAGTEVARKWKSE